MATRPETTTSPQPPADPPALSRRVEDQLCFALYAASRAITSLYRPMLERLGLTYPQYLIMLALWERDGPSVRELGTALQLDYGTLSPMLKRMELAGLVRRERRAEDERSVRVLLTDRGRELDACAAHLPTAVAEGMGLDLDAIGALRDTLRALTESVSRATAEVPVAVEEAPGGPTATRSAAR